MLLILFLHLESQTTNHTKQCEVSTQAHAFEIYSQFVHNVIQSSPVYNTTRAS